MKSIIEIVHAICLIQAAQSFSPINSTPSRLIRHTKLYGHNDYDQTDSGLSTDPTKHYHMYTDKSNRRSFLGGTLQTITALSFQADIANSRGLARFPCKEPLLNTYHFMRAGTTLLEEENIWSTNPLFLTNREAALSELGVVQVKNACEYLASQSISPTVVRYSLAAASVDSANIVGEELKVGRDRLVPEFNYMDPRAIGAWDFAALNDTMEAVWAMDEKEAGPSGKGGRPPPNEDGTPAETLSDQVVRLTNLVSVLETLYSGDSVLLIFPDGTGPALLSCLIGGIPLNKVHEFNYEPGEVRCNVDYLSINAMATQQPPQSYFDILKRGKGQLHYLREHPNEKRNIKDLKFEQEQKLDAKVAEANTKKEAENQLKKKSDIQKNKEYNNSFGSEVGLGAVALIAGGIGVATTMSPSNDGNLTQIEEPASLKNETTPVENGEVCTNDENGKLSIEDITEEEMESYMRENNIGILTKEEYIDIKIGKPDPFAPSTTNYNKADDFDYYDSYLDTLKEIMNEDDTDES